MITRPLAFSLVAQTVISLALIGLAFAVRNTDRPSFDLILGATISYWLRESVHVGQQVSASINGQAAKTDAGH